MILDPTDPQCTVPTEEMDDEIMIDSFESIHSK